MTAGIPRLPAAQIKGSGNHQSNAKPVGSTFWEESLLCEKHCALRLA